MSTPLPTNYQDATTPTGALTEFPATTSRGLNAITSQVNKNSAVLRINVKDYGAVGDRVTDDTTAFTNALAAAAAGTITGATATVIVPSGEYITGPLTLGNRVTIRGFGVGSTKLVLKAASTAPLIKNAAHAHLCGVHDIFLDGNKANVSSTAAHGLVLDNSAAYNSSLDEYLDGRHYVSNVFIQYCKGSGFVQAGTGASLFENITTWLCDGHGFDIGGMDSDYLNCDAGGSGFDGMIFRAPATANRLTNCKTWFSGQISTTAETDGSGHGFHFVSGLYAANLFAACSAQDNARAGFYMNNCGRLMFAACDADSNNTANLGHAGVEMIACYLNYWQGITWDRNSNTNKQLAGVRVTGGSSNVIHAVCDGLAYMPQDALTTDSDPTFHDVTLLDTVTNKRFISGPELRTVAPYSANQTLSEMVSVTVFTGSAAATFTLPIIAGNKGLEFPIMNRGTAILTIQRSGTDQIYYSAPVTSITILPGQSIRLVNDGAYWLVLGSSGLEPVSTRTTQLNLNTSVTETDIITRTVPTGNLQVGSTYRISMRGTIQYIATSGIFTIRGYIGANAAAQTFVMASQGSAAGPVAFSVQFDMTVRTAGATGTYIGGGYGRIAPTATTLINLTSTSAATAVVNTTAATPTIKATAQWATSNANNRLLVETATIEQIA